MVGNSKMRPRLRSYASDQSGSMLIYVGFLAPVLLGVAALGIEVVAWHAESRSVQSAADAAALAAVYGGMRDGKTTEAIGAAGRSQAAANGYNESEVIVNWPPEHSSVAGVNGDTRAVEVIVQSEMPAILASMLRVDNPTISARAVAVMDTPDCVIALNETESEAISVTGSSVVSFPCNMQSNSTHQSAIKQTGTNSFLISSGGSIDVVGGSSGTNIIPSPNEGSNAEPNPFDGLPVPTYSCLSYAVAPATEIKVSAARTFTEVADSAFCDPVLIEGSAVVHFEPGLYVFESGLRIAGGATVTGTDVTFYFAPTNPNAMVFEGNSDVTLRAPSDGLYAGILIFVDPDQPAQTFRLAGGSNMVLDGVVYGPTVDLEFAGGAFGGETPTMLVTDTVSFVGTTFLGNLDDSQAGQGGKLVEATLIE